MYTQTRDFGGDGLIEAEEKQEKRRETGQGKCIPSENRARQKQIFDFVKMKSLLKT
jgi:hypothetical protein